jgi:hypothetical protein
MGPCLGSMGLGVEASVECGVGLKNATQVGPSAPVHYDDEFATHQTGFIPLLSLPPRKLCHGDVLVLLNKNAGSQFGHVDCNYGAQYPLNSVQMVIL